MILRELKRTPRAQRRSKALIWSAWWITLGLCCANAVATATPHSGPAYGDAAVAYGSGVVAWLLTRNRD